MALPPLVYVGPSLEGAEAKGWLPGAQLMPPIRRGDLYRDRLLGFRVFLILDGVFCDRAAVSPREIIDVVKDGCAVLGASSMGAIRAAECWPAGMRGIGSIYRMYRRGLLGSDDEVAVAFCPAPPYASTSVPLINVRYAASRAVRSRLLTEDQAECVIHAASDRHYSDRDWTGILSSAAIDPDEQLLGALAAYDLKRLDAARALRRVRRWLTVAGSTLLDDSSAAPGVSFLKRRPREAHHHLTQNQSRVDPAALWRWLTYTGRYRRYTADPTRLGSAVAAERTSLRALHQLSRHDSRSAHAVWAEITAAGDLEAVVLRFTAVRDGANRARECGLVAETHHRDAARAEIALNHGFRTWREMRAALTDGTEIWTGLEHCCEATALAKRARQEFFNRVPSRNLR